MWFHKRVYQPLKIPSKNGTPKLCGVFADCSCKFHVLSNLLQEIPASVISMSSNLLLGFFYWNSLIQEDVWAMTSSEWELYLATKFLTDFKHLKGVSTFLLILDKKQLTYKISKERRIAIASVVRLGNLSSDLWIIILHSIT